MRELRVVKLLRLQEIMFFVLLAVTISGCVNTPPSARVLSWGVLDQISNASTTVQAGGTFQINPAHKYIVSLNVQDPDGIKHLAVWGDGMFTAVDANNNQWPSKLPASIPKRETANSASGSFQGFVVTDPFVYFNLSCGKHGTPFVEFTVADGILHIHGEETSWPGSTVTAELNLTR